MDTLPKPDAERNAEVLREAERQAQRRKAAEAAADPAPISRFAVRHDLGQRNAECPSHGPFVSTGFKVPGLSREIWSQCAACGAEEAEQRRREEAAAALQRQRAAREAAIGEADIPQRFHARDFEAFNADTDEKRRALTVARDFAEQFPTAHQKGAGLVFAGLPGTGKSHLAAAILLALVGRYSVRYTTCMAMIRMVRDTWRRDSEISERQILRMLCEEIDLLVIDEVGAQYGTDGEQNLIFEVMDRRYSGMRPTILLTNQDKDGFKAFVGDRVFDRLRETSRWVAFDWPSYRPTARTLA
jgi:DNA replication protein DnaC